MKPSTSQYHTEEEFEDDEYDELENASGDDDPNVFKIRNPLSPATAENRTTRDLHQMIHNGLIDLSPSYQRDVVWPETKQITLIDSIFRNFYIPPVVFAVSPDGADGEVRVCVDGKQRLTSIQRFLDGSLPCKDPVTKKKYYYTAPQNSKRNLISQALKTDFEMRIITCVEYRDLPEGYEREIFQRVQLGVALAAAEKLQAVSSPYSDWICELEKRYLSVEGGLQDLLDFEVRRARPFQNLVNMLYCCEGLPNEQRVPSGALIDKWIRRDEAPSKQFKAMISNALEELITLASNEKYSADIKRLGKRISPLEFCFIGVLLCRLSREARADKAKAIYILCSTLHKNFVDVRTNSNLTKAAWRYVDHLAKYPTTPISFKDAPAATSSKSTQKRKAADQDEDMEYTSQPNGPPEKVKRGRPRKVQKS